MAILLIVHLTLYTLALCGEERVEDKVLILTTANFEAVVTENRYVLVEFYAPWCQHCQQFAPEYERLATLMKAKGSDVVVARVDVPENNELGNEYGIKSFPTMKFFRKEMSERILEYTGERKAEILMAWIEKKSGTASKHVNSVEEINELLDKHNVVVVGFFKNLGSNPYNSYMKVAEEMSNSFVHTHNEYLFNYYKVDGDDAIILLKNYDYGRDDFYEEFSVMEIMEFVEFFSFEVVINLSIEKATQIVDLKRVQEHIILFANHSNTSTDELKNGFKSVAYKYRGRYVFVLVDSNAPQFLELFRFFMVDARNGPALRYIDMRTDDLIKYRPDNDDFSPIGITNFIRGIQLGMFQHLTKGEPLPDDWDQEYVKILTTNNFDAVTQDQSKMVIVEFYSPKCFNCDVLHPIFDEVAEHYKDNPDIVLAKTNAHLNEYTDFKVNEYPIIKIFTKGTNQIIDFTSDMADVKELINWIDHEGHPPTKKWITEEDILNRKAREEGEVSTSTENAKRKINMDEL